MQSDQQQSPNGYLHRVLTDGAKPFLYRSGIHSLLGIPDGDGGSVALSTTLPPVGFRYANQPYMDAPYVGYFLPNEAPYAPLYNEQEADTKKEVPGVSEFTLSSAKKAEASSDSPKERFRPGVFLHDARETGGADAVQRAQSKTSRDSDLTGDTVGAEVEASQGIDRNRMQHHVSHVSTEETAGEAPEVSEITVSPSKKAEALSTSTEKSSRREVSPHDAHETGGADTAQRAQGTASRDSDLAGDTVSPGGGGTLSTKTEDRSRQAFFRKGSSQNSKSLSEAQGNTVSFIPASERLDKTDSVKKRLALTPTPDKLQDRAVGEARMDAEVDHHAVNISNRTAAGKIEQLRHTVRNLASKISLQPARTNPETRQEHPEKIASSPVQPVVIIKQFAKQARTPCAFWERSYLGRFHLRTLR